MNNTYMKKWYQETEEIKNKVWHQIPVTMIGLRIEIYISSKNIWSMGWK